jgi:hypothetical protein
VAPLADINAIVRRSWVVLAPAFCTRRAVRS